MSDVIAQTDAALAFLRRYSPADEIVLTSIEPDANGSGVASFTFQPGEDEEKARRWIDARQSRHNIYFTVNPCLRPLNGANVKAKKSDIRGMKSLHVDIDPRPGEEIEKERERALRLLRAMTPPPSFIIDSGGGFQGFWTLDHEHVTGGVEAAAADLEAYNKQLAILIQADNCHNIDRIMRLPGTINVPDAKKRKKGRQPALAKLVEWNETEFALTQFTPAPKVQNSSSEVAGKGVVISGNLRQIDIGQLPDRVTQKCREIIVQGEDPDDPTRFESRSETLFYVCCEMVRAGCEDDTIASVIMDRDLGIAASVVEKPRPAEYAARQIQRAREQVESPELRELNDAHAVIADIGGRCRVISEVYDEGMKRSRISRQSFEDFRNRYMHRKVQEGKRSVPLGKWWLENPARRQYESLVFAPGRTVEGSYNLWQGFACEAIPGKCDLYLAHILNNICSGNQEHYDYLIRWMAIAVQKPDAPGEVAIVLRGRQGTGKGVFIKGFGSLWGRHFLQVSDSKHLVGNFNAHLRDCVVLFGDEAFYAGDKRNESLMKTLVTEETLIVEGKGVDAEAAPNYVHLMLGSNSHWVVPAGGEERRYFVLDVNDAAMQDTAYFEAIRHEMTVGGRQALLHFLMTLDLTGFNHRKFPKTAALQDQKLLSWEPEENWWYETLARGTLLDGSLGWPSEVQKGEINRDYLSFVNRQRIQRPMMPTALGKFLSRAMPGEFPRPFQRGADIVVYDGDEARMDRQQRVPHYEIPSLELCRAYWDEHFGGPWDWAAGDREKSE